MQRGLALPAAALLLIAAIGCGGEGKKYENDDHDFSIRLPEGWQLEEGVDGLIMRATPADAEEHLPSISVVITDLPAELAGHENPAVRYTGWLLDQWKREEERAALEGPTGNRGWIRYKIVEQRPRSSVNRLRPSVLVYQRWPETNVQIVDACFHRDGKIYIVRGRARVSDFETYAPTFKESIETFQFE